MILAALTLAGQAWLFPAAMALAVAGLIVLWSYGRAHAAPGFRTLGAGLKMLGLAALLFCLLEPLWSGQRARPGANLFAIVADDSQSLQVKDGDSPRSRGEEIQRRLDPANVPGGAWQTSLAENFDLRRYAFGTRLQNVPGFGPLTFESRASALGSALSTLAERFRGRPLAGILVFTDGNATDLPSGLPEIPGLPPVYPVVVGDQEATRDLALQRTTVAQSAFEDAPVSVTTEATADGFRGEPVVAQLLDTSGKVVKEERQAVRRDHDALPFRFQFKPEKPGVSFYQVRIAHRAEAGAVPRPTTSTPSQPGEAAAGPQGSGATREATLVNNARVITVDRGRGPYRVLYVSGRPNWEFKFLRRAVQEDPQLDLVGLIRVARREPKFDFRGRAGETSNPLFRGFGEQSPDAVERYDQPVLIALNTRDELELRKGFPGTPEDLFGYHAVILDDLEAAFFTTEQASLLQRFVSERGGGLLMLGGAESFREGGYHRNPIGDMLPVYLDRPAEEAPEGPLRFDLAREGWLETWARVRDNEASQRQSLDSMPEFLVANRVRAAKPGASVIATARDNQNRVTPALVIQRFGRGRTAAFTLGDLWRWGLREANAHADLDRLWRQTLRWLVTDTPEKVEVAIEPVPADPAGAVTLEVRVRDTAFKPLDNATISLEIEPVLFASPGDPPTPAATSSPPNPSGTNPPPSRVPDVFRLRAEPSASEAGVYLATFIPRQPGGYRARAVVTNAAGLEHGRADAGWSTDLAAEEFRSLVPNLPLLEAIARTTGGEVIRPEGLDDLVRRLPTRQAPVMEAWARPLWHTPWMFALALVCLLSEWGLRRWKGLP